MEKWEIIEENAKSIPDKYLERELVNRFQDDDIHRAVRFIKEVMAIKFDKNQCDSINPNCGFTVDKNGRLQLREGEKI